MLSRCSGDLLEGIEGAGVHLSRLRTHDRRTLMRVERDAQRVGLHPALRIGCHGFGRAEAEQPQRPVDRDVPLLADENPDARCAR